MERIARSHDMLQPICQHGPLMFTLRAAILIGRERRMLMSYGYPCQSDFVEHPFSRPLRAAQTLARERGTVALTYDRGR